MRARRKDDLIVVGLLAFVAVLYASHFFFEGTAVTILRVSWIVGLCLLVGSVIWLTQSKRRGR